MRLSLIDGISCERFQGGDTYVGDEVNVYGEPRHEKAETEELEFFSIYCRWAKFMGAKEDRRPPLSRRALALLSAVV